MTREFTEDMDDPYDEIDELTTDDLDEIGAEVERANTLYEKLAYLETAKMPCMECGGAGSLPGGSLGDICPGCLGARVIDHPGADEFPVPDFAGMRGALKACVDKDNKVLPGHHRVPRLSAVRALYEKGTRKSKLLISSPSEAPALPAPAQHDEDYGSLGGDSPSDRELDDPGRHGQIRRTVEATRDGLTDYLFELQSVLQELLERCGVCDGDKTIFNRRLEAARNRFLDERRFTP